MTDWSCCNPAGQCERGTGCPAGGACHHRPDCTDTHCPGHPGRGADHPTHSDVPKPNWLGGIAVAALFFTAIHFTQPPHEFEQAPEQSEERTQTMQATGMLFMSRAKPQLTRDATGAPQLLLRTVHRLANHQTEAYTLLWRGQDAADFHRAHAVDLMPGQPLIVTLDKLRTHLVGHQVEVLAQVQTCALLPRAQAQNTHPATAPDQGAHQEA